MRQIAKMLCLLLFSIVSPIAYGDNSSIYPPQLAIDVPQAVSTGDNMVISGYGASPNDQLVLSTTMTMQFDTTPYFKVAVPGYCIVSTDVMSVEVEPVGNLFMGWQHLDDMEEVAGGPTEVHSSNPYSIVYPSGSGGKVAANKPYHGDVHIECWKMILAGRGLSKSVNAKIKVKRIVQADENGKFKTDVCIPDSKMLAGLHTITVNGNGQSASAQVVVAANQVNDPPVAYIYAPLISENSWKVKAGTLVQFDGSYSADNDDSITSYDWDFGDGTTASGPKVYHAFTKKGEIAVTLTITDNRGAKDTMVAWVTSV